MERAVVTFIDILGFKNLVENKDEDEMREILSLFQKNNSKKPFERVVPENPMLLDALIPIETIFFSDSVVRIRYAPDFEKNEASDGLYMCLLEKELYLLAEIQSDLLKHGILIRGGITIGDISYDKETNQLFGKAMNRAYELESKVANYPRIVIDPTFSNLYSRSQEFIESPIYIDTEMLFSVDYFNEREAKLLLWDLKRFPDNRREIVQYIKKSIISQKELLGEYRKAIVKLLLQSTSTMQIDYSNPVSEQLFKLQNIKIFGKHAWIVNRFNTAVDNWEKVKIAVKDNCIFPSKIFLRDFAWTDPQSQIDENSFSYLPEIYKFEE